MGGSGDEAKEISIASVANLTDHMLEINEQSNDVLNGTLKQLQYRVMPTQEYILFSVPFFQMILQLTSIENTSEAILESTINELMGEALDDPDLFYPPLANALYCKVIMAINIALGRSSNFKLKSFYSVMVSRLSQVNLLKENTIIPQSLMDKIKSIKRTEEDELNG
jgi:hypothetical protein